ncbi:XopAJ/AvrRxo1 family type III secretion system effector zeta toxin [Acidovorax sp. SUPP3434]|uniref:XopAJ/AvrRxo1 family type III secretion system effector zeta toxin n=1 Tax=Acidovorax sp. SUPP3434 TaxID=2920880 RepID=UPI0024E0A01B|nr:XopAJ/AvrRxo1 family type III secretion system effector zeta toxin [Acidovorax sp. SUPP3434]
MFAVGTLPPVGPGRWAYLADPAHWHPERRKLHDALIDDSLRKATVFAECVERLGYSPTLFALRGNTAAGKTRLARSAVPALAEALEESGGGSINPDAFKSRLRKVPGQPRLTPANVHAESCVLADRLERQIATGKTASGKPASMLVDKRLGGAHEVARCIALSEETGRQVEMYDIDMPLERSLLGVLQRHPDGDDPRPPYAAVVAGHCAIRGNRLDVIEQFLAKPQIGTYHLMGTSATGEKAPVATVANGELTIHDADQYAEIVALSELSASDIGEQVIDDGTIRQLTHAMPAAIAETAREALQKYAGLSWSQALGIHCTLTGQDRR